MPRARCVLRMKTTPWAFHHRLTQAPRSRTSHVIYLPQAETIAICTENALLQRCCSQESKATIPVMPDRFFFPLRYVHRPISLVYPGSNDSIHVTIIPLLRTEAMLRSGTKGKNTLKKQKKTMMTIIESAEWISSDELCTAIPFRSQPGDHSDLRLFPI